MAAVIKINDFTEQLAKGIHAIGTSTYKIAFSNTAIASTNAARSDLTEVAYTNISGGAAPTVTVTESETGGTTTLAANAVTITATGSFGPFQYYAIYKNSGTASTDYLMQAWNHGSAVTLSAGETFKISFNNTDSSGTIMTIAQS